MKLDIKRRCNRIAEAIRQEKTFYLFALLAMLLAGLYVAIVHARTLPPAEGWYTYYSQCIHGGRLPYRDFDYLYPPVYIYTIALFTGIFGYSLIALRRLGILLFAAIALGLYLSLTEIVGKKRSWIALIASVCAVFYMQSEVVQIFYDYIRLMDLVAVFCLYALLRAVKGLLQGTPHRRALIALGILSGLLINIKQNVGLIFFVFSLVLLGYVCIWCRHSLRRVARELAWVLVPALGVIAVILLLLLVSGSMAGYLSMTGFGAAGAKGGMKAILFGWIVNNRSAILDGARWASLVLLIVGALCVAEWLLRRRFPTGEPEARTEDRIFWVAVAFSALFAVGMIVLALSRSFAVAVLARTYLNPYAIFEVVAVLFVAGGVWGIVDIVKKRQTMRGAMMMFALAGAYFAIAFSCGNSGGIAEGQSSFGVACIVAILLWLAERILGLSGTVRFRVARYALCGVMALVTLALSMHLASKKMVDTYNWWGMDESDYWTSTERIDAPLLKGIKVSAETKALYEGVYGAVTENTAEGDSILCFPQIPLFYSVTSRTDPGIASKVQWFDVASDASVRADIDRIRNAPPKAILIYNTSEDAYAAHENAFRGGQISATREMREFLYEFVAENGYCLAGSFSANSNSISVWVQGKENAAVPFASGNGSEETPYVISTVDQFLTFVDMVNSGRTFSKQYIVQAADIDLGGRQIDAIGNFEAGIHFGGVYDGNGYVIRNALIAKEKADLGLFAYLSGTVMNLGVEGLTVSTDRCATGLVAHSASGDAAIVNCFVKAALTGYRAGGITDDFYGRVENCVFVGTVNGEIVSGAISMPHATSVYNVYAPQGSSFVAQGEAVEGEDRVTEVSTQTLNSTALADILNAHVDRLRRDEEEKLDTERLLYWTAGRDGYLVLVR